VRLPKLVREHVKGRLWALADQVGWIHLSASEKARHYEHWTTDADLGGTLSRYLDKGRVRVYLKDTLLKDYTRARLADDARPLRVCGIDERPQTTERYIKPHGRRLADGRILCWGRADDWKLVLLGLFERSARQPGSTPCCAVLMRADGKWADQAMRAVVEDAAKRLGVKRIIWLES
jgi:hypothetical protein